ncbi:TetR/AcrR family transcriptional regulator [Sciscionella marina]|uniref:TetR/AcrR family transcriptional regulator n=1 Tax=Sciscionella marina TaxID=508770 RepID=UPI00037BFE11|nr:TetR/AcrR family transcriptional regulator C-terminal domain-containing protein [Sciscionella marina]
MVRKQAEEYATVWERPEPVERPVLSSLSRDRIVRAAIELADAEGLGAVSFRRIAGVLEAGPMRLYGYLATKEELFDLMVDAVYAEIVPANTSASGWRARLTEIAHRTRETALRHDWLVDLFGGRPNIGPNGLAFHEASLAALDEVAGFEQVDTMMDAIGAVHGYVLGAVRAEVTERRAERATGMDEQHWQQANGAYMTKMLATGAYPMLARVVEDASHPAPGTAFTARLEAVLDGIEARFRTA